MDSSCEAIHFTLTKLKLETIYYYINFGKTDQNDHDDVLQNVTLMDVYIYDHAMLLLQIH
jgi:hypothetical protein